MGKCEDDHVRFLPSARYMKVRCPNPECEESFIVDNGEEHDRHEYAYVSQKDSAVCPGCSNEYDLDTRSLLFGFVRN